MGRKRNRRRGRIGARLTSEKGYLLLSTLFFLMFSGLFAQSMIKVSSNHIIQLRQLVMAYEAKSALNLSAEMLLQEINENNLPEKGVLKTSEGNIVITSKSSKEERVYVLSLKTNNSSQYKKELIVPIPEEEEELELDESEDLAESEEPEESKKSEEPEENLDEME